MNYAELREMEQLRQAQQLAAKQGMSHMAPGVDNPTYQQQRIRQGLAMPGDYPQESSWDQRLGGWLGESIQSLQPQDVPVAGPIAAAATAADEGRYLDAAGNAGLAALDTGLPGVGTALGKVAAAAAPALAGSRGLAHR